MTDRYDELSVAPDPERAEALRRRLHTRITATRNENHPATDPDETPDATKEITVSLEAPKKNNRNGRMVGLAAASIVLVVAGLAVVFTVRDDADSTGEPAASTAVGTSPAPTVPAATEPTAAPTSTIAPLSDAEIAAATLLADDEYAPGWIPLILDGTAPWGAGLKMDPAIGERVPACAPFIDTAFETPTRDAVVDYKFFNTVPPAPPSPEPEYVVVFPDETGAKAMFDAVTDPAFFEDCVQGYGQQMTDPKFLDPDFVWFPFWPGTTVEAPEMELAADQVSLRAYEDKDGQFLHVVVRVGRIVVVWDAILHDSAGQGGVPLEQLQQIGATIVDRARAALAGEPIPSS